MPVEARMPSESWAQYAKRLAWLHRVVEVGQEQRQEPLRAEWSSWLGMFPWSSWGTLTFKAGEFTSDAASRAWANYHRWLSARWPLATYFVAHEVGARGRLHMHCLIGCAAETDAERTEAWEWWFKRYGRAQIAGYDPERGAAAYVSKYVSKDLELYATYDLDLRGFTCLSELAASPPRSGGPTWRRRRGAQG